MNTHHLFNVLEGFDFNILDNPEFKEDSVREEIALPIIRGLGYSPNKPHQIIRSRRLLHPFVSIGSQKKKIHIIPDYLFEVNDKPAWILDAKAPTEDILRSHHVEQAYSYAIHSEVRVNFFALCNGKEFALYSVDKTKPVMHFPLWSLPAYWESLQKFLSPQKVFSTEHFKLAKDLGLHLKRLGFDTYENLIFRDIPVIDIGQLDPDMFSFSAGINENGNRYVVTFDFDNEVLMQLEGRIPADAINKLSIRSRGYRQRVSFGDRAYPISVDCKIGVQLEENQDEIFLPLVINRIIN